MKKIRIVICDDSDQDRGFYAKRCREVGAKHGIDLELKEYVNGNDLLFDLEDPRYFTSIDIILLNIHMPGPNGIEVANKARTMGYQNLIIFVTGSKDYYEPAFDVRGFNYITKGKDRGGERFERVLLTALKEAKDLNSKTLILSSGGKYQQINISSILYFEVNRNIVTVYYGKQKFEFLSSLNKLENQLYSQGFFRVQKSYLIAVDYVKNFNYQTVTMQNGAQIPIGRKYYKEFKEMMDDLAGSIHSGFMSRKSTG